MNKRYEWILVLLLIFSQGCSTVKQHALDKQQEPSAYLQEQYRIFSSNNPRLESNIGALNLTVRMATPIKTAGDKYAELLYFPVYGTTSAALGTMAAPMFGGAMVLGGVLLVPLGTYIYMEEKEMYKSFDSALVNISMTQNIKKSIERRLSTVYKKDEIPNLNVEIIIETFGLTQGSSHAFNFEPFWDTSSKSKGAQTHYEFNCLVLAANLIISEGQKEIRREYFQITDINKSVDAPPPQCGSLSGFMEDDAILLKSTFTEYAEVIAAVATQRIVTERQK